MPEIQLAPVFFSPGELTQVRFEDAAQGDTAGVVSTASYPQLTESCARICSPNRFADKAGLTGILPVTIVLVIELAPDGYIGVC
jgi:hypothetical protein